MTLQELHTIDLTMPIEDFYAVGYYKWKDGELICCLASDAKDGLGNIIQFPDKDTAVNSAKGLAAKYCREEADDGTLFCSVAMRIQCGGGREPEDSELAYFSVGGMTTTRDELNDRLEMIRNMGNMRGMSA